MAANMPAGSLKPERPGTGADTVAAALKQAVAQHNAGRLDDAQRSYQDILHADPAHFDALQLLGAIAVQQGRWGDALDFLGRALRVNPGHAAVHNNIANALKALGRFEEAVAVYDNAIRLKPDYAEAFYNRANALTALGQTADALRDYQKAIDLKPDYAAAHCNLGLALQERNQPHAAIRSYDTAIALRPGYAQAYFNRGNALKLLRRLNEACASYDLAIRAKPDYAAAYCNKSYALLLGGDLQQAWPLYEWRWQLEPMRSSLRDFGRPLWTGAEDLRGKTIFLEAEQGLGDSIQFCRYIPLLAEMGAQVVLELPRPLLGLLSTLAGVTQIVERGQPMPPFDYRCPLMSLPLAFSTELHSIPGSGPYLFADDAKTRHWQEKIGPRHKLKVGLVWSGGHRPDQPAAWAIDASRNIPVDLFAQALQSVDADFFSLQKGDPAEADIRQRAHLLWPRGNFYNYTDALHDFSDTAALIAHMDVVLSVDTSTAHVAAALGKPTWILNRYDTCWRWLLDRDDSPWYRSVTLYRQAEDRDWALVLRRVARDLSAFRASPI